MVPMLGETHVRAFHLDKELVDFKREIAPDFGHCPHVLRVVLRCAFNRPRIFRLHLVGPNPRRHENAGTLRGTAGADFVQEGHHYPAGYFGI
ncbi:hypothetical protein D9M71_792510 [compost metagenome]